MNLKTTVPLAAAVVLGLVAAIVASQLVKAHPVAVDKTGGQAILNMSDVVVAAHDIAPGQTLGSEDLKVLRIESSTVPANTTSNPGTLLARVAKVQIPAGQMVHESLLAEKGVAGGLPGVIAQGYRAFTMEINEFTGVAGMLEPGNRIDILARVPDADGSSSQMTRTIVQNVQIIAVGSNLTAKNATGEVAVGAVVGDAAAQQPQKAMPRSITMLVTPEDAEKIDLACASNNARIVLRASNDTDTAHVAGATVAALRGNASRAMRDPAGVETASSKKSPADSVFGPDTSKAAFKKSSVRTVTVIRAGQATQMDVDEAASDETPDSSSATPTTAEGTSASAGE